MIGFYKRVTDQTAGSANYRAAKISIAKNLIGRGLANLGLPSLIKKPCPITRASQTSEATSRQWPLVEKSAEYEISYIQHPGDSENAPISTILAL
jgi:hypothetical protein